LQVPVAAVTAAVSAVVPEGAGAVLAAEAASAVVLTAAVLTAADLTVPAVLTDLTAAGATATVGDITIITARIGGGVVALWCFSRSSSSAELSP
jgi:hypothetical protein